jgi:glycosyltransferase involved in cell wall biosynthesis
MGLSVIIITKNEATDLPKALNSVRFADEVIVLDSGSTDATCEIAASFGAKVFQSTDWPGFGPQKNRALAFATQEWVLSIDADEWLESSLAEQIQTLVKRGLQREEPTDASHLSCLFSDEQVAAYCLRRRSIFIDKCIQFGDWRGDRVVRLFRRGRAKFSEDLVHERLVVNGKVGEIEGTLGHHSVRSLADSREKMWRYNLVAAQRISAQGRGGRIRGLLKASFSLLRGLVLRLGVLDGSRGIQLAWFNAVGTYLRYALAQTEQDKLAYLQGRQSIWQRIRDWLHLIVVDHGFLRSLYDNRHRLPGGLYRVNQPSPGRLSLYKERLGIKTVINLRGANEQLGWYRLEEEACKRLGLHLRSIQVQSRGLVDSDRLIELENLIQTMELPAVVHCKSGADRAGFFSVLYRHFRLGEPIELAMSELSLRYGHFKSAKTGVLDHFFEAFLYSRLRQQGLMNWIRNHFERDTIQNEFKPRGVSNWLVDRVLQRE